MPAAWLCAAIVAALTADMVVVAPAAQLPEGVDPATGFRMGNYRAPTPDWVPGGIVIDGDTLADLLPKKLRIAIDVYAQGVVADPIGGGWAVSEPHMSIPGAVWLPFVGSGKLTPMQEAYYRTSLTRLTANDRARGLVFFCLADCWHSWNAAKRAADWGYTDVAWYPLGTDGWVEDGRSLAAVTPEPIVDAKP